MRDHPITLAALIAGAVITLIGVFMWAGAWAALAAFGFIVFLVALAAAVAGWLLGEEIMRMEMMNVWILSQAEGSRRWGRDHQSLASELPTSSMIWDWLRWANLWRERTKPRKGSERLRDISLKVIAALTGERHD
jgi:hypothetical protein